MPLHSDPMEDTESQLVASCTAMNHLDSVDRLANRFSVMRHAQSKANAAGIIVSRIENDRRGDYGLTDQGRWQALTAARGCGLPRDTIICSSDFSRARQTAEIVRAHLGAPEVVIAEALRERCFGQWEGSAVGNYARVWAADEMHSRHARDDVEPAADVLDRATAFVAELERRHSGRDILLVSHGDTLQILQAGFLRADPSGHRSLPHLETAEIRRLDLRGSCLASGGSADPVRVLADRIRADVGLYADPGGKLVAERGEAGYLGVECGDPAAGDPGLAGADARAAVGRQGVAFQQVQAARAVADVSDGEAEAQQLADHAEAGHLPRAVDPLASQGALRRGKQAIGLIEAQRTGCGAGSRCRVTDPHRVLPC